MSTKVKTKTGNSSAAEKVKKTSKKPQPSKGETTSESKIDKKTKETIAASLTTKKYSGVNYDEMDATEQKKHRARIRNGLFSGFVNPLLESALKRERTLESDKKVFEGFKKYLKENYTVELSQAETVFRGNGTHREDWDKFVVEFKKYQKARKEAKAAKV